MKNPESNPETVKPADEYSAKDLAKIWIASYRFSQGSPMLQQLLVSHIGANILPEEVVEDKGMMEESYLIAKQKAETITKSSTHTDNVSSQTVQTDFRDNVIKPILKINSEPSPDMSKIMKSLLSRDAHYLPANSPSSLRSYGTPHGRYYSYTVRYVMLDQSTACPEIDLTFQQARPRLAEQLDLPVNTYKMIESQDMIAKQPDKTFTVQAILDEHLADNPRDTQPVAEAMADLTEQLAA